MNYLRACKILDLSEKFNYKQLKHNYYIKALKYHPDKNVGNNTNEYFQEINAAYNYLNNIEYNANNANNANMRTNEFSYTNDTLNKKNEYIEVLKDFLNNIVTKNLDIERFINILNSKCENITTELLKTLPKNSLLNFKILAKQYSSILNISNELIEKINNIAEEFTKNDNTILLNPTLSNLLNDELYIYNYNQENIYIPYWHHELVYDLSDNSLIVMCEPRLPDCAIIDKYNNLYISISCNIKDIIYTNNIEITIANKLFNIPIKELKIIKKQRYSLYNIGIPEINKKNIYSIETRSSIFFDITFNDIN